MPPAFTWAAVLAIAIGAIPGALSRYYLTLWCKQAFGDKFPYGTFMINFTGCLIMGLFITLPFNISNFPTEIGLAIATGFLGAYTTFSTYSYDTLAMWRAKNISGALVYWVGSAILGVIGVQLGFLIAGLI